MTRNPATPVVVEHAVFGTASADRLVIVLRDGPTATSDPDPVVTLHHDVRVLAVRVGATDILDDSTYGGETPAASAVDTLDALIAGQLDLPPRPFGLVAVGGAAGVGCLLADRLGEAVDRMALVAVRAPDSALDRDLAAAALRRLDADTLIVVGEDDPSGSAADADFYAAALPHARVEVVPGCAIGLGLTAAWPLVLDHLAG